MARGSLTSYTTDNFYNSINIIVHYALSRITEVTDDDAGFPSLKVSVMHLSKLENPVCKLQKQRAGLGVDSIKFKDKCKKCKNRKTTS